MEGINAKNLVLGLAIMVLITLPITTSTSSEQVCLLAVDDIVAECTTAETEEQVQSCCIQVNTAAYNDPHCFCLIAVTASVLDPIYATRIFACDITASFEAFCRRPAVPLPSPVGE
ncbi:hypothetical protein vseg_014266 [Gypsophila vaccaria]